MNEQALTIRVATPRDARALARLAGFDSRHPLRGRALLAEHDGVVTAAIALTSGSIVRDPFQPAAEAVRQLRFRRYQILRQGGDSGPARSLLRRLVPATAAAI